MTKPTGFILLFFILVAPDVFAQDIATHHVVVLLDSGKLFRFSVPNEPVRVKPDSKRIYHYLLKDRIRSTQAGYAGILLDGPFEALYADNALHSQGRFAKGEKSGRWRFWRPDGKLMREESWKNGDLHGQFAEYDEDGYKTRCGRFRKGLLHGKVYIYNKGAHSETLRYRKGEIREKERGLLRWPNFKKKTS